jgi:phospholipase/carboxylesterase
MRAVRPALVALLAIACTRPAPKEPPPVSQPTALQSIRIAPRAPSPGKPPLLILLHGRGTDEHDLAPLADHFDPRFDVRSVRAPFSMGPGRNIFFDFAVAADGARSINTAQEASSRQALLKFIDEAVAADGADPTRVYLAGFSQGGIMALSIALTNPQRIAGAVSMSGRLLPELDSQRASPESLRGLPLLVVHGTRDQVMPIEQGHATQEQLSKLPVALTYREFPMVHEISRDSLATVASWLSARLSEPARADR